MIVLKVWDKYFSMFFLNGCFHLHLKFSKLLTSRRNFEVKAHNLNLKLPENMSYKIDESIAVKAVVFDRKRKKFLLIKRSEREEIHEGLWDIPGGKIETGETLWEGLVREIYEETGIKLDENVPIFPIKC